MVVTMINEDNYIQYINILHSLNDGWNGYDAECPNDFSVTTAQQLVPLLLKHELNPIAIKASADGGIAILFIGAGIKRAFIEILNTREIYTVLYDLEGRNFTILWPENYIMEIKNLADQLITFLFNT